MQNSFCISTMLSEAFFDRYSLVILATKHKECYVAKQNYQAALIKTAEAGVDI